VLAGGLRAWFGLDGFWAGMLVTLACVAPLYFLLELLGHRFPLDRARDVAVPDQAERRIRLPAWNGSEPPACRAGPLPAL